MAQELVLSMAGDDFAALARHALWRRVAVAPPVRRQRGDARIVSRRLKLESWQQVDADLVRVVSPDGAAVCRVILRLVQGEAGVLYRFGLQLLDILPLRLDVQTRQRVPGAVKARMLDLDPAMPVQQALAAIIDNCVEQVQANEAGVTDSRDPEYVHQMRVGLRRLNAALGLFRNVVPCPQPIRDELRWIRQELGVARDWEVLATDTLAPMMTGSSGEADLSTLQQVVSRKAAVNRRRAAVAVRSARYTRCLLALGEWTQTMLNRPLVSLQIGVAPPDTLLAFARRAMDRRDRQLRRRGRKLRDAAAEARHEVRLVAKRVRYAAEFFRGLYLAGGMRVYLEELAALQEVLGRLNDADVAVGLLREPLPGAELVTATGFVRGYLAARCARDLRKLQRQWKRFRATPLPAAKAG